MRIRTLVAALAVGYAATLSPPAKADTFGPWTPTTAPVSQYDGTYVSLGAGGFLQQTPNFNYLTALDGSPLYSAAPNIVGGMGGVTLGIILDNRRRSWPGKKPRIEFSFGYARGSGSNTQARLIPDVVGTGGTFFYNTVDGTSTLGFGCGLAGDSCTSNTRLRVGYQNVSGAIRLKTDVHLARNLYITPSLGFVGNRSSVRYKLDNDISSTFNSVVFSNTLNENLKTTRLGGEAAADVTWNINGKWTLHGGASFALFRMGTRLNASDCLDGSGGPAGTPCSGNAGATNVNAFDHQTGYRVGMNTGVTYNGGWFRLTLVGQGRWDSDLPGVQNPTSTNAVVPVAPARITYSSQWRYGGFISVAFPF